MMIIVIVFLIQFSTHWCMIWYLKLEWLVFFRIFSFALFWMHRLIPFWKVSVMKKSTVAVSTNHRQITDKSPTNHRQITRKWPKSFQPCHREHIKHYRIQPSTDYGLWYRPKLTSGQNQIFEIYDTYLKYIVEICLKIKYP